MHAWGYGMNRHMLNLNGMVGGAYLVQRGQRSPPVDIEGLENTKFKIQTVEIKFKPLNTINNLYSPSAVSCTWCSFRYFAYNSWELK